MITKKYEAKTEQEALLKVKEDLGVDALILSIKRIKPNGIYKFFRKPYVEVTASIEEKKETLNSTFQSKLQSELKKDIEVNNLEKKIDNLESLLNNMSNKLLNYENLIGQNQTKRYKSKIIEMMHYNLTESEVIPELATKLLHDLDDFIEDDENEENINLAIKIVYNRIIDIIGTPQPIVINKKPIIIIFMGPTGVGKTTTIAKLASKFMIEQESTVGFITADTYRIAAVEQLKVYAEIIGVETKVLYSENEVEHTLNEFSDKDIIFIDTAGRSHKNNEQINELNLLLEQINDCERYLVLSMTTKYKDLMNIINTYSMASEYSIIFTKADETSTKGNILNICYLTGKSLSYISNGQNVPEDIELVKPEKIARALLGRVD